MDEASICCLLDPIAAGVWLVLREELIDTDGLLPFVHLYAEVFIELTIAHLSVSFTIGQ
jgi:hypothetical protein